MCEHSKKLVAWIDQELDTGEIAAMERHCEVCSACRETAAKYRKTSRLLDAYCESALTAGLRRSRRHWVPALSLAAAVLLCVLTTLAVIRERTKQSPVAAPAGYSKATPVLEQQVAGQVEKTVDAGHVDRPRPRVHRRHVASRPAFQATRWLPAQPTVEIAIPAESLLPPGALPEGLNFAADVSLAPDGTAEQMRLRPQLVRWEGRPRQ